MPIFVGAGTSSFAKGSDGVGFSRVTTTQRNAISSPISGQVVFNTTTGVLEFYDGTGWYKVSSVLAVLSSVSGNIVAGLTSTLTLAGTGFLSGNLVVNFEQSTDGIGIFTGASTQDFNLTQTATGELLFTEIVPSVTVTYTEITPSVTATYTEITHTGDTWTEIIP